MQVRGNLAQQREHFGGIRRRRRDRHDGGGFQCTRKRRAEQTAPLRKQFWFRYDLITWSTAGGSTAMRLSLSRARERRDITVPIGIASAAAISS